MPRWIDALKLVIDSGVSRTYETIKQANAEATESTFRGIAGDKFDNTVKESIRSNVEKWAEVSRNKVVETLQDELTNTLQKAYDERVSTQELSGILDDLFEGRGEIIARTEVLKSIGTGKYTAYKANGVKWKQWIHRKQGPTAREEHIGFDDDGPIPMEEVWQSEYGPIRYPGDPEADPGDLCNCGCGLVEANAPEGYEDEEDDGTE